MHLNQWLESVADEERTKTAGLDLERVYDQLEPEELLKIATGEADLAEVLEKRAGSMSQERYDVLGEREKSAELPLGRKLRLVASGWLDAHKMVKELGGDAAKQIKTKIKRLVKKGEADIGKTAMAKLAFFDQIARQVAHVHTDIEKGAGIMRPEQPTARELIQGRGPKARAARTALREKLRAECPVGRKIDKQLGLTKEDEFVTPEAKTKAKVMRTALRATKGAPANVRKAAVKQVGQKIASIQ